ncbi:hypothetical protein SKAU_G00306220 [Synaphobranchus kaupii]|uniref:Uncharacterized protein n=1 Tax=Synaphobranchus kaupii TaxID=118154 RepID=A0A9Q1EQX8_SYNKA|nr:hypothetical protein SKAU_G00306220 [Synaphobranchus kaupii]
MGEQGLFRPGGIYDKQPVSPRRWLLPAPPYTWARALRFPKGGRWGTFSVRGANAPYAKARIDFPPASSGRARRRRICALAPALLRLRLSPLTLHDLQVLGGRAVQSSPTNKGALLEAFHWSPATNAAVNRRS